ncbi:polysaccharide biosynthesis protein [Ramlibacter sp. MAHUQ-53]|uniref:polysaccharide biosynthesis protein n=1 Tax=unclassified Ramlibacter TaxID=2617605 RepID=UPI00362AAA2D
MLFRKHTLAVLATDLLLVGVAWLAAFWLRFNFEVPAEFESLAVAAAPLPLALYAGALVFFHVHRQVWRFAGLRELQQLAQAVVVGGVVTAAAVLMLRLPNFPRSVLLLQPLVALLLMAGARAVWRSRQERRYHSTGGRRLLIVGSLDDAAEALRALRGSQQWEPVGIASPDPAEVGRTLQDLRVLGTLGELAEICADEGASTALVASPPGSPARRDALLGVNMARLTLLTLPRPDQWLAADGNAPRKIELEDLLGRDPVQLDVQGLSEMISGQTVLVTGAGGSIGSELCRQIARLGAAKLVCVDVSEYAIYALEQELRGAHPQMRGAYYTANVREAARLRAIVQANEPTVMFHAAAYKHVPLMEQLNEVEALRTNVLGTLNAARVAGECGVRRFVMISTDKAVNPTNIMGASKRLAELVVQGVAAQYTGTQYVSVRFGNVLGSSGSVVPLFTAQIAKGGPVTVTHPDIVRYFMTIPEAAQLVLQAGLMGQSGQIFVLDMGEPVKIAELARMLIRLSGHTEDEIPITYSGLRPGEKLYEELLADDETTVPTPHPKLRVARASGLQTLDLAQVERWVEEAGPAPTEAHIRAWLRGYVPEYQAR